MKRRYLFFLQELKKTFANDISLLGMINTLEGEVKNLPEKEISSSFDLPKEVKKGEFALFADGACRGNPGAGSWGIMGQDDQGAVIFEASGFEHLTTNNKMELEGAIQALENLKIYLSENNLSPSKTKLHLYCDAKYVVDGLNQWIEGWKARGWKKADKGTPENLEWWQRLDESRKQFMQVQAHWVKGHDGHPQNERCDQLANQALDESL